MNSKAIFVLLVFGAASLQLTAQQAEADRRLLAEILAKAEKGDAQSQAALGQAFLVGELGVAKDQIEGVKWLRKAAEHNSARAQSFLGCCFAYGHGVAKNYMEAVRWYRKAAEQNNADAQLNLGYCYANGQGVAKDEVEAVKWYRKASEQNDAGAQFNLGFSYANGQGVVKDEVEAVKWYRKAAEQGNGAAQFNLGSCYENGNGVRKDEAEAVTWFRKAAEQGIPNAEGELGYCYLNGQGVGKDELEAVKWFCIAASRDDARAEYNLGVCYQDGKGVERDYAEAVKWFREAAAKGDTPAQYNLGVCYSNGQGVSKDEAEAVKWYRQAAEQDDPEAQLNLGACYFNSQGVPKDYVQSYKWFSLAFAQGNELAKRNLPIIKSRMTPEQIADGQNLARKFKRRIGPTSDFTSPRPSEIIATQTEPGASGTGFFITEDGYLISNYHVVKDAAQVRLVTSAGLIDAKVVRVDPANDLALLKAKGKSTPGDIFDQIAPEPKFTPLPVTASRTVHLGNTVATIGFPNIGMQGFAPKFVKGEIAALSGAGDDVRYFQISVPVQPGNSGGALVDEHGNVVGVVSAKLDAAAALAASGALPENVNYAIKSSFLLSFLESSPEVSARLKEPVTTARKFDDVVQSAQQAAVLVLVY